MINIVAKSDIGLVRDLDEDSVGFFALQEIYEGKEKDKALLALADGMGGHSAGEVASRIALETIRKSLLPLLNLEEIEDSTIKKEVVKSYLLAESNIKKWSEEKKIPSMGTTLVLSIIFDDSAFFANVGDSRAYIFSNENIIRVTYDNSLVFSLAENGVISFDDMKKHPQKNIITKAIGPVDVGEPQFIKYRLYDNDIVLLCCDGLWETVEDIEMFEILRTYPLDIAAEKLMNLALKRGADDNVSFIIAKYKKNAKSIH